MIKSPVLPIFIEDFLDAIDNDLRQAKELLELKTAREICDHEFFDS